MRRIPLAGTRRSIGVAVAAVFGLAMMAYAPVEPAGAAVSSFGCIICQAGGPTIVGAAPVVGRTGPIGVTSNGTVYEGGQQIPGVNGLPLRAPIVGIAADTSQLYGSFPYWLVGADGAVFAFNTPFRGSMGGSRLNAPIVGMVPSGGGFGYWLVAADGGVFAFGDASFFGSMGGRPLNAPIVGMAVTRDEGGYWLVAADGGVFAFGDASFFGSMGGRPLNAPVIALTPSMIGPGYFLFAKDGGVFALGGAAFRGSFVGQISRPVVSAWGGSGSSFSIPFDSYSVATSDGGLYSVN